MKISTENNNERIKLTKELIHLKEKGLKFYFNTEIKKERNKYFIIKEKHIIIKLLLEINQFENY